MTASVGAPAATMIRIRRGRCRAATNSSTVRVGTKSPSPPWAAISASVFAWVRLCRTTWWPCRAKLRARFEPIVARPVTPICSVMHRPCHRRRPGGRGSVEPELPAQLGDVTGGLDVVLGSLDAAVGVDHEGRADDADDLLAVQLLRAVRAVGTHHLLVGVGDQRDAQV